MKARSHQVRLVRIPKNRMPMTSSRTEVYFIISKPRKLVFIFSTKVTDLSWVKRVVSETGEEMSRGRERKVTWTQKQTQTRVQEIGHRVKGRAIPCSDNTF